MKRALISVYDKEGILEFAKFFIENNIEIISTGGTYKFLKENNIEVTEISEVTGFKEILDGRVKTLHPLIHGGILALRDNKEHISTLDKNNIKTIDYVIVNLYPFFDKVNENISFEEKIEFIDIGGPSMLRSAGKSFKDVLVICDKNDYQDVLKELKEKGDVSFTKRRYLASKVFNLTSAYDAAISNFLSDDEYNLKYLNLSYEKVSDLRYGENSHQKASFYIDKVNDGTMKNYKKLNGKELSFNNIRDMDLAFKVVNEFDEICCCAVKHSSPCGVAIADSVSEAYEKAYKADSISIFGGIVAFNSEVDEITAKKLKEIFLEIVIAPSYSKEAIEILKQKKNLRVIEAKMGIKDKIDLIKVDGGLLVQSTDNKLIEDYNIVTENKEIKDYISDLNFAMKVVKYVKSNAIVIAQNGQTLGISGGMVNRIWATEEALKRAEKIIDKNNNKLVLASDAFFPFSDVVEEAVKYGVKAIIQPGGSINDKLSINACNQNNIIMVFTGLRHFKH